MLALPPLLVDVGDVPACHCDSGLDHMFKAWAENPDGDERSIWTPHDNPYLTPLVEDVTARLSGILERLQDALARFALGEPLAELAKALPWMRWDETAFEAARSTLEQKPPELFTLDDWLLLVDYLLHRYLGDGVIETEAQHMAVRAAMVGKIQSALRSATPPPDVMARWNALLPTGFATVPPRLLTDVEWQTMQFAKARAATSIGHVKDNARAAMRSLIVEHVQAQMLGQKEGTAAQLKTRLFDSFGQLNRDFRRIAVTEAGEAACQGFIAAQPYGTRVTRREAYRNACPFCRSINGLVCTVVDPAAPDKRPWLDVWLGKSNLGRSASARKRVGSLLVGREEGELWWPAAGVQHPHCRGCWVHVPDDLPPGLDPVFAAYVRDSLAAHQANVAVPGYEVRPGS